MKTPRDMDEHTDVMQENILKMHGQRCQIMDAKNPQERERLMQAHREFVHHHMQSMKNGGITG